MNQLRGKVTKITFHVEYPNGETKDSDFVPEKELNAVFFSETYMTEEMKKLFTVSRSDWKANPAMIIVDGKMLKPNCDYPDCQNA